MAVETPPYLLRLKVNNFRSLRDVDLSLRPLTVLVGPNGAGKSNLLDVIAFLGDSVRDDLGQAVIKRGGFRRVAFRGGELGARPTVSIDVEAAVTPDSLLTASDQYTLNFSAFFRRVRPVDEDILSRNETFLFRRSGGSSLEIFINGSDITIESGGQRRTASLRASSLGLATLPRLGPEQGSEQVDALAELFAGFRVFDVDVDRARTPGAVGAARRLDDDASNLAPFLLNFATQHPDLFGALIRDARTFIPGLEEITFHTVGGASEAVVLRLRERGLRDETDLADASFGSIRALALLALLYDPNPPHLTCIEEIDHGLHPYVLDRLVELLRQASHRTQLIVATHSPPLVNRLQAEELVVCERREDGSSAIPAIDPEVVRRMEGELGGELGLGELWFTGALGGVPDS